MADMAYHSCLVCCEHTAPKGRVVFWPLSEKNSRAHTFFCNFINGSYYFSGTDPLYVYKQPCFTKLQQASDKLECVMSIISDLKEKNGRVGDVAAIPASLGCYVQSVTTPTSSVPAKRAATGSVPRAKKLLRLEVNDISDKLLVMITIIVHTL